MAKKRRFPLEMESGVEVRSLEELREHFSLARVLVYASNGKLVTWLRARYEDEIADGIEQLDAGDADFSRKICQLLDVPYNETSKIDLEKIKERNRKLSLLKDYTTEEKYSALIDEIAFNQDDVYDLLDEGKETIYLCGERFAIPLAKKGIRYYGINMPTVVINSKVEVDWSEKKIVLENVKYDEKYHQVLQDVAEKKREYTTGGVTMGGYSKHSYLSFLLSPEEKKASENCYNKIRSEIEMVHYDIDDDIKELKEKMMSTVLIGLAEKYIENL